MKKNLLITIIFIIVLMLFCNTALAAVVDFSGASSPTELGGADGTVKALTSTILAIARTIGLGIAIVILMVIGCKYMIASPGEKADIKTHAINYVIGAVVMFAAAGILSIIKSFVDGMF